MKRWIHAASNIGTYRGVSYGIEDSGDQRYYFVNKDGKVQYADLEEELFSMIDQMLGRTDDDDITGATSTVKASMEEDPEVTEAWDNYDPYSGKIYLISDTRGNVKKTDYPKNAIEYWAKMQVKDPMSADIQTKKKVDAIKLTDFVANNPEFIYNLAEKYKLPYKPQYLISESEKKSADGQKYFYENEWGDSVHPFGVG